MMRLLLLCAVLSLLAVCEARAGLLSAVSSRPSLLHKALGVSLSRSLSLSPSLTPLESSACSVSPLWMRIRGGRRGRDSRHKKRRAAKAEREGEKIVFEGTETETESDSSIDGDVRNSDVSDSNSGNSNADNDDNNEYIKDSTDDEDNSNDDDKDNNEDEEDEENNDSEDSEDNEEVGDGIAFSSRSLSLSSLPGLETVRELWRRTPPITRTYLSLSCALTLLSYLLNDNRWPAVLSFQWFPLLFKAQLWRLVTPFFFLGRLDIFFPLTVQFVWQHMSQLEKLSAKQPAEFLAMLVFGALTLIATYTLGGISFFYLGHNLATFLVYVWSRLFEGQDVNFMDICVLKSELLPWFFSLQTFLLEQQLPVADLMGIAVGHAYWYLKQKKRIFIPRRVKKWFASKRVREMYAPFQDELQ